MLDCKYNRKSEGKKITAGFIGKISARASRKYHYDLEKERIYIVIMVSLLLKV